jgi:hypothetical protein
MHSSFPHSFKHDKLEHDVWLERLGHLLRHPHRHAWRCWTQEELADDAIAFTKKLVFPVSFYLGKNIFLCFIVIFCHYHWPGICVFDNKIFQIA